MREMHKWKDKVELSLDNRQIFFLFFGLSVVGCFVFALGIMTGRRVGFDPEAQVAAIGNNPAGLMTGEEELERFAFPDGLALSSVADLPATRDPSIPPRPEEEVKAEKAQNDAVEGLKMPTAVIAAPELAAEPQEPATMAAVAPTAGVKRFTLQMKAFSRGDEANSFADKLRKNGHDVRVETTEARGRTWHRVRLGTFTVWEEALAAKTEFESAEHVIAYVVSE